VYFNTIADKTMMPVLATGKVAVEKPKAHNIWRFWRLLTRLGLGLKNGLNQGYQIGTPGVPGGK